MACSSSDSNIRDEGDTEMGEEVYATPPEGVAEAALDQDDSGPENESPELRRDRMAHDQRLRGRFEDIFAKYSRDFTEFGDEIDIETGEIVVDNGHLRNMLHEADPGQGSRSLQLARDFVFQLEHEDDSGSDGEGEDVDDSGDDDNVESDGSVSDADELAIDYERVATDDTESDSQDESDQDATMNVDLSNIDPQLRELIRGASVTNQSESPAVSVGHDLQAREPHVMDPAMTSNVTSLPTLQESLEKLSSTTAFGREVDSSAIQALGKDIADQLARYVDQKGKTKIKRKTQALQGNSTWDYPEIPAFKRRCMVDPQPRPQLVQLSSILSPQKRRSGPRESIWAPIHHPKQQGGRRARGRDIGATGSQNASQTAVATTATTSMTTEDDSDNAAAAVRECAHCHIKATTAWRLGPDGESLCNACGMYWYRYDLMRPLRPPTPDPLSEDEASEHDEHRDPYPANISRTVSNPGYRSGAFTTEEDALIIKLKEIDCLTWERIGRFFPGRSHYGVQCRYSKRLNNQTSEGRNALVEQGFTFEEPPEADLSDIFTTEQDELLIQLREDHQFTWGRIAKHFPGKTDESVEFRYNTLLGIVVPRKPRKRRAALKAPENHQRSYSKEEDELIIRLREVHKLPWELLAQEFPQRTWLALQKRYVRTLAHRHQVMRDGDDDPYTYLFLEGHPDNEVRLGPAGRKRMGNLLRQRREEDLALIKMRDDDGLTFEEIAEALPGRSAESLHHRYDLLTEVNSLMNVPAPTSPREEAHEPSVHERLDANDQAVASDEAVENGLCMIDPALEAGTALDPSSGLAEHQSITHTELTHMHGPEVHVNAEAGDGVEATITLPVNVRTRSLAIRKYTKAEHARIAELRSVNLDWKTIAAELPDRTPASIASYWAQYCKHKALSSSPISERKKRGSKQSQALLRQAADNGTRRIPNGGKRAIELPSMLINGHPGPMNLFTSLLRHGPDEEDVNSDDEEVDEDFANVGPLSPERPPNRPAQPKDMSDEEVNFDFAKLGQGPLDRLSTFTTPAKDHMISVNDSQSQAGSSPNMPQESGLVDYGIGTSIILPNLAKPISPAVAARQFNANVVHSNIKPPARSPNLQDVLPPQTTLHEDQSPGWTGFRKPGLLGSPPSTATPHAVVEWRARAPTRLGQRPRAMSPFPTTTPAHACVRRPPVTPIAAATPSNIHMPASSPFMAAPAPAMYSTPARHSEQKMPYFIMPAITHSRASLAEEEELLDLPDDMVDAELSAASSEEDVAPATRKIAPTSFTHPSPIVRSSSPPGATLQDRLSSIPCNAGGSAGAPPFSWADLITMALKSSRSQQSEVREMQRYLEDKFPYFKSRGEGWKRTLRAHLATSSDFQKLPGRGDIWTFRVNEVAKTPKRSNRTRRCTEPWTEAATERISREDIRTISPVPLADAEGVAAAQPNRDEVPNSTDAKNASPSALDEETVMTSHDETNAAASTTEKETSMLQTAEKAQQLDSQNAAVTDTWVADMLMVSGGPALKRGPGRPPKNGVISIANMRALEPKRRPGRPPGAKNKPREPQDITEYGLPSSFLHEDKQDNVVPEYEVPASSKDILQRQLMYSKVLRPKPSKDAKTLRQSTPPTKGGATTSSEAIREPESSPVLDVAHSKTAHCSTERQEDGSASDNEASNYPSAHSPGRTSSSPTFMQRADRTPVTVYSRSATPGQSASAAVEVPNEGEPATQASNTPAPILSRAATPAGSASTAPGKAKQRLRASSRSATPAKAASSAVEKLKQRTMARGRSATPGLTADRLGRIRNTKASSMRQSLQSVDDMDGSEDELA